MCGGIAASATGRRFARSATIELSTGASRTTRSLSFAATSRRSTRSGGLRRRTFRRAFGGGGGFGKAHANERAFELSARGSDRRRRRSRSRTRRLCRPRPLGVAEIVQAIDQLPLGSATGPPAARTAAQKSAAARASRSPCSCASMSAREADVVVAWRQATRRTSGTATAAAATRTHFLPPDRGDANRQASRRTLGRWCALRSLTTQ